MRGWLTDPSATTTEGLSLVDDLPEPAPKPDEVVIDVKAYSINRGELPLIKERAKGFRPGQDVAGVIVRLGSGALHHSSSESDPLAIGTRVVGIVDWHGWAERVCVHRAHIAALPNDVSFAEAATLPVAGLTALRAVRAGGTLLGKRVLVLGATGGVGQIAVQLAVAAGARVTALVSDPQHFDHARSLGAHVALASLSSSSAASSSADELFDLVIDGVGGPTLVEAIHRLAPAGTAVMFGVLAGKAQIDIFDFARCPGAKLLGLFLTEPGPRAGEELATLVQLVAQRDLRPAIALELEWTQTPQAIAAIRDRKVRSGKVVLTRA